MTCRALIRGARFENKGAEAMIRCVQRGIIDRLPEASGLLEHTHGADWSSNQLRGLTQRNTLISRGRGVRAVATAAYALGGLVSRETGIRWAESFTRPETGVDLVVDITGYGVGDTWLRPGLKGWIAEKLLNDEKVLAAADVPFVYLPQSWGPFRHTRSRRMADRKLQSALRLYARDHESLDWLKTLPSFDPDRVALASDIAFTFEGASSEVGRRLLDEIGITVGESPVVGIVPNMRVYERIPGEGRENLYLAQLIRIARHFADRLGCRVAVMPHEIKETPSAVPDDRYLCGIIADAASDAGVVRPALGDYSSEELKAMIGEIEMLISSRFHSIVAAMSLRVPIVSIAWSHKYRELMDSVGLEEYVVEHDRLEDAAVIDLCEQAWDRRSAVAELLAENVPAHEASAQRVLDQTVDLIRECTA